MAINWFTFFAQIINFVIVLFLLKRFLFGPILSVMNEREAQISARFKEAEALAEQARTEAAMCRSEREALEEERDTLLREAALDAGTRRESMISEARTEVAEMQQGWYAAVEYEKQRFLQDVRTRMGETIYHVARDTLADLANAELEQVIVDEFLTRLDEHLGDRSRNSDAGSGVSSEIIVRSAFKLPLCTQERIRDVLISPGAPSMSNAKGTDPPSITYTTSPDLICGIEVQFSDRRISWNVRDYLDSYVDKLDATLVREMSAPPSNNAGRVQETSSGESLPG